MKTCEWIVELIQELLRKIDNLKNLGKYQEAFQILEDIHDIQDYSQNDQIEYKIAKSKILFYLFLPVYGLV